MRRCCRWLIVGVVTSLLFACSPEEAPRVELPVVEDASGIATHTSDLGYDVTLHEARMVVEDVAFSIAGEVHEQSLWQRVADTLVPSAHAHPGHFQGGDVTGELRGRFVIDWFGNPSVGADAGAGTSRAIGTATLIVGRYRSANFVFGRATAEDGVSSSDPLYGHTAVLGGTATRSGDSVAFTAVIDSPEGRLLVGAPFAADVRDTTTGALGFRLVTEDPFEGDQLFDGVDFAALDADGDGNVAIDPTSTDAAKVDAYNQLRRTFLTHDHYDVQPTSN